MFCYSNNGYSMRAVEDNYIAQDGEVLFRDYVTTEQLIAAFPNYNDGPIKTQTEKLQYLDAEYEPQFTALTQAWATAMMDSNATLADSIKQDKAGLKAEYEAKRQVIING